MSANTNITEGGKGRPFGPVKALMVQGSDGKYYPWFPESDRALGTLSVDKNGVYKASDKGVYGWSRVSVNVPQNEGVTGRDPDTGEDVYVHPDPSGELVKDVLPVEIRVIEPPTNPYGTYVDGQTITKDGMVVKAYGANGDEMQIVPVGEITINPTTAVYDASTDTTGGTATLGDITIDYSGPYTGENDWRVSDFEYAANFGAQTWCFSSNNTPITITYPPIPPNTEPIIDHKRTTGPKVTPGGHTYYMVSAPNNPALPVALPEGIHKPEDLATILYDGTRSQTHAGSPQTINVSWPRPGDGAILETTFDINVGPHGGTGDD